MPFNFDTLIFGTFQKNELWISLILCFLYTVYWFFRIMKHSKTVPENVPKIQYALIIVALICIVQGQFVSYFAAMFAMVYITRRLQ